MTWGFWVLIRKIMVYTQSIGSAVLSSHLLWFCVDPPVLREGWYPLFYHTSIKFFSAPIEKCLFLKVFTRRVNKSPFLKLLCKSLPPWNARPARMTRSHVAIKWASLDLEGPSLFHNRKIPNQKNLLQLSKFPDGTFLDS